ncbi:MAG: thioredoxin domain-containing protein [Candidatus Sulfotelmatobacter sp.]
MSVVKNILRMGLGGALAFLSVGHVAAQNEASVVAEVGGVKVTMADLEQEESAKLLSAHYQYYQAETRALNDLIDKKLIEQKAQSEHLTIDQLLDREVNSKVKDPTEDQMRVYYEGVETEQPYEAVRGKILDKIRELRTQKARAEFLRTLHAETTVYIALAPPRANVEAENPQMTEGPAKPAVTLVEFADYECPYCQKVAADVKRLADDYLDKVAFTFKDFPLPMHARAEKAAEAARCAGKQNKFWEFHDELFRSKELDVDQLKAQARALKLDPTQFDKCLDSGEEAAAVDRDRKEGTRLGLNGTPSFFINGHFMSGAVDYVTLRQIVDQQLKAPPQNIASNAGK